MIDDLSTDKSYDICSELISEDERFSLVKNKYKMYALGNTIQGINIANPKEEDIIVVIDGDDWLSSSNSMTKINKTYLEKDCWMTYGSYVEYPSGNRGKFAQEIPQHVIQNNLYRDYAWSSSQLRTFKYFLWKNINKKDLLDEFGEVYKTAGDLAHIFPMLEMAGERSQYIRDIVYVYNLQNPVNDHKKNHQLQLYCEQQIRQKNKYKLLERK